MAERLEDEWRTFELYEKIRLRERRKKFLVSALALILFFTLCAVPVVKERSPKWRSLRAAQRLSIEIEKLKTLSIQEKKPAKITFLENGSMKIEVLNVCTDASGRLVEQKEWKHEEGTLKVLSVADAKALDVKLVVDQICFDPVFGLDEMPRRVVGIIPVKDLTEQRLDRASYIVLDGDSAKISID